MYIINDDLTDDVSLIVAYVILYSNEKHFCSLYAVTQFILLLDNN